MGTYHTTTQPTQVSNLATMLKMYPTLAFYSCMLATVMATQAKQLKLPDSLVALCLKFAMSRHAATEFTRIIQQNPDFTASKDPLTRIIQQIQQNPNASNGFQPGGVLVSGATDKAKALNGW